MVLPTEDRILIKALRQKKSYSARKLIAKFPNKTCTVSGLSYTYGKSRPQAQWTGGKTEGQNVW